MKGIWRFFKRQLTTKTGKAALGILVGAVVNSVAGDEIGAKAAPVVTDTVVGIVNGALSPEMIGISLLGMYLRDRDAKKDNGGG